MTEKLYEFNGLWVNREAYEALAKRPPPDDDDTTPVDIKQTPKPMADPLADLEAQARALAGVSDAQALAGVLADLIAELRKRTP